jgi:CxxC-x17-CxxC domain-containing protein
MDEGRILIANLSKGKIGEDNSRLLGALLITKLQLAAMSRVDIPEEKRRDFFLYVDEFQNFATEAFVNILSEARKYRLSLILANQYIAQLEEMTPLGKSTRVRDAVFGNVGTIIVFRVGAEDAEFLEKEFQPEFTIEDLTNLTKYHVCIKLMIDGIAGSPFSAATLPKKEVPQKSFKETIIRISRERYGTPKEIIEEKIEKWAVTQPQVSLVQTQKLYDAVCSICGKKTKIPFLPDPSKPVYCKSCLKKLEREKEKVISLESLKSRERKPRDKPPVELEKIKKTLENILKRNEENR